MAWLILLTIITLPVIEIVLFAKSAEIIGGWATIALAILAGVAGISLLRHQGLAVVMRARRTLQGGEIPLDGMFDTLCLTMAGILLVLPGFLTDFVAVLLLLPPVRMLLRHWVFTHVRRHVSRSAGPASRHPTVIEGDYQVVERPKPPLQ